jgi:hypothetical protein
MPLDNFQGLRRENLNYRNHVLNLPTGTRIYVRSRLYDRDRKIRSCTSFFRPDGILLTDEFTREKTELIPVKKTTQSIKQSISIKRRREQSRQ